MSKLTDLEMTRLCAEAMGLSVHDVRIDTDYDGQFKTYLMIDETDDYYWPLDDDAQAMALDDVLLNHGSFRLNEQEFTYWPHGREVTREFRFQADMTKPENRRRARVECVAKMEQEKRQ